MITDKELLDKFRKETGIYPIKGSLENCKRFSTLLVRMLSDAEKAKLTVRHIQRYAEELDILSSYTFYYDQNLNAMMNWAIQKKPTKRTNDTEALTGKIKKLKQENENLVARCQRYDDLRLELMQEKEQHRNYERLFKAAANKLREHGLENELKTLIEATFSQDKETILVDAMTGEIIEESTHYTMPQ